MEVPLIKSLRLLILVLAATLLVACAVPTEPLVLSKEDCANVAMAAGLMQEYINHGEKHPVAALTKGAPEELPPQLKEHILLMETFQLKFKGADPQGSADSYFQFCIAAKGDVAKMNEVIRENIAKPVGEPV